MNEIPEIPHNAIFSVIDKRKIALLEYELKILTARIIILIVATILLSLALIINCLK